MAWVAGDMPPTVARPSWRMRLAKLAAKPSFQRWSARFPLTRTHVRKEGEALFDLVQGFVASQVLRALIELRLLHRAMDGPLDPRALSGPLEIRADRLAQLLQAGAALGLLRRNRDRFEITTRGAALLGVPGLEGMIRHHDVLYRDLADPVALLRGQVDTEMVGFWPYVFGGAAGDPDTARLYSGLMSDTQGLVAEDTLDAVSLSDVTHLMDVGGGHGTFAKAVAARYPRLALTVLDLPVVVDGAPDLPGITFRSGSFRDAALPADSGADAISLIRVLYDHDDDTVRDLLRKARAALPAGGRIIISEPMSGGAEPDRACDVYFAFYTMAMRTGTVRSAARISELLDAAGFAATRRHASRRPFVTQLVEARRA
ncbi:demethylspheroidene O-methyltransferase [Roseivivax lentus]|uniref:Demethylspheroidene O-methyltransferase n=1 Tax=Roseivivax lentus TaxID=633194 RepID=A0A1N7JNC8_9RHOB|nr:methyltransferase [Roseivivax lentus]SIS50761.1 demethylspheroidene O-methyltransferase [Roseivivax lentus]